MRLAARGLRDMDDGVEAIPAGDRPAVRARSRRLTIQAVVVAAVLTLVGLLAP